MAFALILTVTVVAVIVLCGSLKHHSRAYYGAAIGLEVIYGVGKLIDLPEVLWQPLYLLMQQATLSMALFVVVMFVGVFSPDSRPARMLRPVRAELSVLACLLVLGHMVVYLLCVPRLFTGGLVTAGVLAGFVVAVALSALLAVLGPTSAERVKRAPLASAGGQGAPSATGNPNSGYYHTFANMKDPVMTREEALEFLYNPEMATEPITPDDGTVIPAVYVNLRNRWNRIGVGIGSQVDLSADYWTNLMKICTEEEAAQYLELPIYHPFTAAEYAEVSGRSVAECTEICDKLAMKGVLPRFTRAGVPYYYLTNQWLGGNMHAHEEEYKGGLNAADWAGTQYDCGTPIYQVVPVSADVVAETNILPLDDWKAVVERNEEFVIAPCACRVGMAAA